MLARFPRSDLGLRVIVAALLCGGVFWLDLSRSTGFLAAALYVPLALVFYGRTARSLFVGLAAAGTALNAIAALAAPTVADNAAVDRGLAALILWLVCWLVQRLSLSAAILVRLLTTDPLTGAYSRDYFMELVRREQRRAARYRVAYSILLVDVDDLKAAYGRGIGDQALRTIAALCKRTLRPTDMLARYGDGEFIIALTHTGEPGAVVTARRVRDALAAITLSTPQGQLSFATSIGVSSYAERADPGDLIIGADHARFLAKSNGRNRVCVDHGPDAPPLFA